MKKIILMSALLTISLAAKSGIYEKDSRAFITQSSDSKLKELASKVAVQIPGNRILNFNNKLATIYNGVSQTYQKEWLTCDGEKFNSESSLPTCTAFLVKNDIILTAGHCGLVNQAGCDNNVWVFDYFKDKINSKTIQSGSLSFNIELPAKNTYRCKKIISSLYKANETDPDYSLIQLDRPVLDRLPFKIKAGSSLIESDKIFTIGAHGGTPLVSTEPMKLKSITALKVNGPFTLFAKGSGGPAILEKTGEVVGIMVSSNKDYHFKDLNVEKCQRSVTFNPPWLDKIKRPDGVLVDFVYASAIRIDALPQFVKSYLGVR